MVLISSNSIFPVSNYFDLFKHVFLKAINTTVFKLFRSVGIVRLRTKGHGVCFCFLQIIIIFHPIVRTFLELFRYCVVVGGRSMQTRLPCVHNRLLARKAAHSNAAQSVSIWPHAWRNGSVSGAFGSSATICPFYLAGESSVHYSHIPS
jgi:hypothetical protein